MHSILILTSTYPRWKGDNEPSFVHSLCRELATQYSVTVLAPHYPGAKTREVLDKIMVFRFRYFLPFGERLTYDGGILANLKKNRLKIMLVPFFVISQFMALIWVCTTRKFDLVHAHWVIPQGFLAIFGRQLFWRNAKILCTSHGGDLYSFKGSLYQTVKRFVFQKSDWVTVVSTTMKQKLKEMGWGTDNVTVQSMGVDLTKCFVPDIHTSKETDLVFVGRLVEKKGAKTLIEAMAYLKKEYPTLKLRIVGGGPEKPSLVRQAQELGVDQQIDFTGPKPNSLLPEYYRSARVAVVPSIVTSQGDQEGLGLVAIEALGCGCATIVSDLPAFKDIVEDSKTGLVFQSGNSRDLGDKIRLLLNDEPLLERLASKGRNHVVENFDWKHVGNRYSEIIKNCLSTK